MKCVILLIFIFCSVVGITQPLLMTDETTDLNFETRHLIGKLEGTARGINGTLILDSLNPSTSSFRFSFATSTFLHNDFYLGPDLTRPDCFDVNRNPTVDLVSSSITKLSAPNQYLFKGALIIKGISRDITFPITATPNIGGYDIRFQFQFLKRNYQLQCAFHKRMTVKVKGYAKRKLPEAGDR